MKVWYGHGSEHSANLVMIGRFTAIGEVEKAKQIIDDIAKQVKIDVDNDLMQVGAPTEYFTDGMLDLLGKLRVYSLRPNEVEQLAYEVNVEVEGEQLVITTEENDVSVLLKILIEKGARVEVYSAHNYPDSKYGRGR